MNRNKNLYYAAQKKVWATFFSIYALFWIIIALLSCMWAVMANWPLYPSIIMIFLLSLFIAFFPASILALLVLRKVRRSKLKYKKPISIDEFLLRCDSSAVLDTEIAKYFRETLGDNLSIDHEKIYPEDTKYDLLYPLVLYEYNLKAGVDSMELYVMMEETGHPITMEQADEAINELSNLETICERINYLSKIK